MIEERREMLMSPLDANNRYITEADINHTIIPVQNREVINQKCPCGRGHLLHHDKEPLAYYGGKIWGLWCAITAEFSKANYELSCAAERIMELELEMKKVDVFRRKLGLIKTAWKRFSSHYPDCKLVELAGIGRPTKDSDCTCGFLEQNDVIMKLLEG